MNISDDENVCSVQKENNLGYYRLHTIWRKDGFFINITSKNGAWRGEMTPSDVAKMSEHLEIKPESYLNQCKEALTCHGGQPGVVYAIEDGCFTWKSVEDEDTGIKVKMGSVMLEPTNFVDTIQNLVTAALNCNEKLFKNLKELTQEKEKITENKNNLFNKFKELAKVKETMENDLYARFILLINAKKRKIQELESLLNKDEINKLTNSTSPYEVDTDDDSVESSETNSAMNVKEKKFQAHLKKIEQCNQVAENSQGIKIEQCNQVAEDPQEIKNLKNDHSNCECVSANSKRSFSEQYFPQDEPEKKRKYAPNKSLTQAITTDELYDYFYGESQ